MVVFGDAGVAGGTVLTPYWLSRLHDEFNYQRRPYHAQHAIGHPLILRVDLACFERIENLLDK